MKKFEIAPYDIELPTGQEFLTIPQAKQRFGGGKMQNAASITKELIFGNIPVNTPGKYHVNVYSAKEIVELVTGALGGHIIFLGIK